MGLTTACSNVVHVVIYVCCLIGVRYAILMSILVLYHQGGKKVNARVSIPLYLEYTRGHLKGRRH